MKVCTKCEIEKDYSCFNKRSDRNILRAHCKTCSVAYQKIRRNNDPDYYKKENIKRNKHNYYIKNKEKLQELNRLRCLEKRYIDPLYKLTVTMRSRIRDSFRNGGFSKSSNTYEILGCSFEELKKHLESKFENWMTWENKGLYNGELNYGWDIDHIVPISSAKTEEDIIKLNHYTNLQPLCSYTNRHIKSNKF